MKEEVCRATGKEYKREEEKKELQDKKVNERGKRKEENVKGKKQQVEWWDKECEEMIKKRKKIERILKTQDKGKI